jgi:hypothetical protein
MGSKVACATLWSSNAGDQNILIAHLWPSRHVDPRIVGIKPWDPQDHGIKSGLRGTFHESGINAQNKDIGFQISSTESGIKSQPHPLVLYIP